MVRTIKRALKKLMKCSEIPKVVYKFYSLSSEYHLGAIYNSYWYFSKRSEFNDPLDFYLRWTYEQENRQSLSQAFGLLLAQKNLDANALLDLYKQQGSHVTESDLSDYFLSRGFINRQEIGGILNRNGLLAELDKFINKFSICCMSKSCNSTLMWSHYANHHKGICIGFDAKLIEKTLNSADPFTTMEYSNKLPEPMKLPGSKEEIMDENFCKYLDGGVKAQLKWKSKCWEYEDEVRLLAFGKLDDPQVKYDKKAVKEVILGWRTPPIWEQILQQMFTENGVQFRRCFLDDKPDRMMVVNV